MKWLPAIFILALQCHALDNKAGEQGRYRCRINDDLQFLNPHGKLVKRIKAKESQKWDGKIFEYQKLSPLGCKTGRFAAVFDVQGRCEQSCENGPMTESTTIYFYDAQGNLLWKKNVAQAGIDLVSFSANESQIAFIRPGAVVRIDTEGRVNEVSIEEVSFGPKLALSPNARYGVVSSRAHKFVFFDFETHRIHIYDGPGTTPGIDDAGEIKVRSGPAGEVVYVHRFGE